MSDLHFLYDGLQIDIKRLKERLALAERVVKAAASVASEEKMREELLCYVQGVELIEAIGAYYEGKE